MATEPEHWFRIVEDGEDAVRTIEVNVEYDIHRSEKDKAPAEYVTLTRAQMERFLLEAGYMKETTQ